MLTGAFSLMTFTAALAEAFGAVGMSTIVPNLFVQSVRSLKASGTPTGTTGTTGTTGGDGGSADLLDTLVKPGGPIADAMDAVKAGLKDLKTLDLLVPKTAKLHAEFEFHASESYDVHAEGGVMIELVTVKAGYQALYESSSSNKITLDVDFATVAFQV